MSERQEASMRHPPVFMAIFGLALALAAADSGGAAAQDFYGTGATYTGQKLPIQTLNAIDAEKRQQAATAAKLQAQRRQLETDRRRASPSGEKVDCVGKTAALGTCSLQPMPQFDRRANTLEQEMNEAARQAEQRIKLLQDQP
jgi:hypothetical protein